MSVSSCTLALLLAGASANTDLVSLDVSPLVQEAGRLDSPAAPSISGSAGQAAPAELPDSQSDEPQPPGESATATGAEPAAAAPDAAAAPQTADEGVPPDGGEEIIVVARPRSPQDPLVGVNLKSFETIQVLDKAFVGPMAMTYKETIPRPVRSGVRNFLRNLTEPVVFLNFLLQLKPGKAAETVGRFAVNSTVGVVGLFDVAKKEPFNLPYRNNGFGNTLGYYGVKPGPFLYLPLIGPTTVRDLAGRTLDMMVMPFAVGRPFNQPLYAIPTTVVRLLDERAEADQEMKDLRSGTGDPYTAVRENYLRTRQAEIDELRGKRPAGEPGSAPPMPEIPPLVVPQLPR